MKLFLRTSALVPCLALLLAAAPLAHAGTLTITGFTVYEGVPGNSGISSSALNVPAGTNTGANGVFSAATDASITSLNYSSASGYTVDTFYLSPTYASMNGGFSPTGTMADTGAYVTGTLYLPAGVDTLTTMTDDGVVLTVNGSTVISDPLSQFPTMDTGTFTAPSAGLYSFTLLYAENSTAPATLVFSDPYTQPNPTPEPNSLYLMGTGLLAAAGLVRRRLFA